jgi:hypothetical protein
LIGILIGLGHSVLAMSGEETLAQVYREVEHPKLPNLEKAGFIIFVYSLFSRRAFRFSPHDHSDAVRPQYFGNLISGLAMNFVGPYTLAAGVPGVRGDRRRADAGWGGEYGHRGLERRAQPRLRGRHSAAMVPPSASPFRHFLPHAEHGRGLQLAHDHPEPRNIFVLGEAYAFGVMWSFAMKGLAVLVLRYKQPGSAISRAAEFHGGQCGDSGGTGPDHAGAVRLCIMNLFTKQVATIAGVSVHADLLHRF